MRKDFLICICAFWECCNFAIAQKNVNIRPKWIGNTPKSKDAAYYFVEVSSDASVSLDAARTSVRKDIASNVERTDKVSVNEVFEDHSIQKYDGSNVSMQSQDKYQLKLNVEGVARPITSRRIDEYWSTVQRNGVAVLDYHALYAVERKNSTADFSNVSTVSSYGIHGLWRSAIIPGWGQFYKGSNLKGGLMLGGTVAFVGGIIFAENQRSDYVNKIAKIHDVDIKRAYATKRDHCATARNICIGGAAALYVYNLIDAIVAPGARRVVEKRHNTTDRTYGFVPTILDGNAPGMAMSMTF